LTGILPVDALNQALSHRFKGDILQRNLRLIEEAAHYVPFNHWKVA
jgi:pyruvate ferredoxin oxidoreductase gamma subunit